jgi:DNA-binding beta-propeller fold protein YncE
MTGRKSLWSTLLIAALASGAIPYAPSAAEGNSPPNNPVGHFELAATYRVSGEVAEIVAATPDGQTLIYTDSEAEEIGFVDITNPAAPVEIGKLGMGGEPTSVAVTPDGAWALVAVHGTPDHLAVIDLTDRSLEAALSLGGQPDSVSVSPDGRYAAIAVENERDEDLNDGEMPQSPAGFLTIVDLVGQPSAWTTRDVALTGLAGRFPEDPEPEFVDINSANQAAVTLQENNHVAVVDLASGSVVSAWSAGTVTHLADTQRDGQIIFDDMLTNARREPDAVVWTPDGRLITANEGDYDADLAPGEFVGGRNFTIFSAAGAVLFDPGGELEMAAAAEGLYDDRRSNSKGCEFEGAEVGVYRNHTFAFVGSERCHFVAVYRLRKNEPKLVQLLPTGSRPEGLLAIPRRSLFVTSNEGDGTISIFQGRPGDS